MGEMTLAQAIEEIATLKEANARLKALLKPRWAAHQRLPFSRLERVILGLLVQIGEAPTEKIIELVWGDEIDGGPDDPNNVLKATMSYLRRKLAVIDVKITTVYGFGYIMSKEDRTKLAAGDFDNRFEEIRKQRHVKMEKRPVFARRKKPAVPMSDRPKGKWSW